MSGAGYPGPDGATKLGYDYDAHQARDGAVYQLMLDAKGRRLCWLSSSELCADGHHFFAGDLLQAYCIDIPTDHVADVRRKSIDGMHVCI